jgi:error-prone DNA polymerase
MGFYAPAQLVRDAIQHGVAVRPVDILHSFWDCALEPEESGKFALRLGFRQIKGFGENDAKALVAAREQGDLATMRALWLRAGLSERALETLARGDSWNSIGLGRRDALWAAKGMGPKPLPLFTVPSTIEPAVTLPAMPIGQEVTEDYRHLRLSLKRHPVALLRDRVAGLGVMPNARLQTLRDGARVRVAGLVLVRQQPGTASGVIFMTIEDETGVANIIVWPKMFQTFRRQILGSQLLAVRGIMQRDESGCVIHVIADRFVDLSAHLHALGDPPSPYDAALARADEVKGGGFERRGIDRKRDMPASRDFR